MGRQELVTPSAGNIRALLLEKGIDRNEKQRRVVLNWTVRSETHNVSQLMQALFFLNLRVFAERRGGSVSIVTRLR